MSGEIQVSVDGNKYQFLYKDGKLTCRRYGEPWGDFIGNKAVYSLMAELHEARAENEKLRAEAILGPAPISHEWPACGCAVTPPKLCDDAHQWVFKVECAEAERGEARTALRTLIAAVENATIISSAPGFFKLVGACEDGKKLLTKVPV